MGVCHCLAWGSVCVPSTPANSVHLGKKRGGGGPRIRRNLTGDSVTCQARSAFRDGWIVVCADIFRGINAGLAARWSRGGSWSPPGRAPSGIKPGLLWIVGIPITGGQLVRGPPEESDVCSRAPNRQITALPAGWRASCFVRAAPGSSRAATSRPQVSRRGGWREEKLRGWA